MRLTVPPDASHEQGRRGFPLSYSSLSRDAKREAATDDSRIYSRRERGCREKASRQNGTKRDAKLTVPSPVAQTAHPMGSEPKKKNRRSTLVPAISLPRRPQPSGLAVSGSQTYKHSLTHVFVTPSLCVSLSHLLLNESLLSLTLSPIPSCIRRPSPPLLLCHRRRRHCHCCVP